MDFGQYTQLNNVFYLTPEDSKFSREYLAVRKKEGRILTDDDVQKLPYLNRHEWPFRIKSTERFIKYITNKKKPMHALTIGCGNGWFAHKISQISNEIKVIGLDVNREELEQASRVFKDKNLQFVYADIFKAPDIFKNQFDIIVLNGAIQYFKDFKALISQLKSFLKANGEIHIIDSPFYKFSEIENAKRRTKVYYKKLGIPEMASNYFAHDEIFVKNFDRLYTYKKSIINKLLGKKDSPFTWFRLIKK